MPLTPLYKVIAGTCALSWVLATTGCAQVSSVEAPVPVSADVYADQIGDSRFEPGALQQQASGYSVQSGNLLGKQGVSGAMVVIRAPDGAVTVFVDREGNRGLLQVDASGKRTFTPDVEFDPLQLDTVEDKPQETRPSALPAPGAVTYVDALVGFTTQALAAREVDPYAFALGQMEWVNLSLRNSAVRNIELRLAGVLVTQEDIPVTTAGLSTWQQRLTALRSSYRHDINVGFSVGGDAGGWAYRPGYSSVNSIHGTSPFKHEMGHNVGGAHCYPAAGDNYRHGFDAGGGFTTNLCGNSRPYYSTPDISVDGRVIGDAKTADMARLWREQAGRLSSYSPALAGERLIYVSTQGAAQVTLPAGNARRRVGVVALSTEVGPISLVYGGQGVTTLTVKLQGADGRQHPVNFRALRHMSGCPQTTTMNSYQLCHPDSGGAMTLILSYEVEDNLQLPAGWYNGTVELKALDVDNSTWSVPILVTMAVRR